MRFLFFLKLAFILLGWGNIVGLHAQIDYSNLNHWAFHPNKIGTLMDGFNLNIALVDAQLQTTAIIENENNAFTDTGVDVFFIHPTLLQNLASYTTIENIPIPDQNSFLVAASIRGQAGLLAQFGRFFAPRYRQATPPTFLSNTSNTLQANVLGVAYEDVKAAFLHYLENHNNGNKIILASHSQGANLTGFLLRDVFDSNPQLTEQLIVAVVAGVVSNYTNGAQFTGGWWENIPFCTQTNECGCVMNWRTYQEGQNLPIPLNSHPCKNPQVVNNGWAFSEMNPFKSKISQDSLYYSTQIVPLQKFITLRSNVNFGGNVGYVAFDDLYSIRYLRTSPQQVGFAVSYTPQPNDQRPNLLAAEELNPQFAQFGFHQKDYNIYTWALLEQINQKLAACGTTLHNPLPELDSASLWLFPNPARERIYIWQNKIPLTSIDYEIFDSLGKKIDSGKSEEDGELDIRSLSKGLYWISTEMGILKFVKE